MSSYASSPERAGMPRRHAPRKNQRRLPAGWVTAASRAGARNPSANHDLEPNPAPLNHGRADPSQRLFRSFFAAGFECSTHILRSGRRLDLVHATAHDKFARLDYQRLAAQGIRVAREGVRWHLVESKPGRHDFSTVRPILEAARATHTQVIWDLCHFGWPDGLDVFGPEFISRLADYGAAFAAWLRREADETPFIVPVNEISFFSWAAGDEGSMYPFTTGRGFELKAQLVKASLEAMKAIWAIAGKARFVQVDPLIHVVASPTHPEDTEEAEAYRLTQFQAWDMLRGKLCPELGGAERFLDIVGVNFYPYNEWFYNLKKLKKVRAFKPLSRRHPLYQQLHLMLLEVNQRYQRPLLIAETGAEDRRRAGWLEYVCEQASIARAQGIPLQGICLYPILNHPGWADDRHCCNGLWDYPDERGNRQIYAPLAGKLKRWRTVFEPAPPLLGPGSPAAGMGSASAC